MRRKIIAGNWKMNKLPNEAIDFIQELTPLVKGADTEVILFVPYTNLFYSLMHAQGTNIKIGAQNMHWEDSGTFTGEISGPMLKAIGVEYVIVGHSDRRLLFGETSEITNKKLKAALRNELKPILCIGETREERDSNKTEEVVSEQLKVGLEGLSQEEVAKVIFAYEPVWAISSGAAAQKAGENRTASKEDANDAIKMIRGKIAELYGNEVADKSIIQYGGSMKSSNAKELNNMSDIDGGLVGGASLEAEEFSKIVNYNK